jgi:hypothetical protein
MTDEKQGDELRIRIAGPEDMDEAMNLAISAAAENGFLNANPAKLAAVMWPALNQDSSICAVIGRKNGPIEGIVVLVIGEIWYSDAKVIEEKAVFIPKKFRDAKGGRAGKLCDFCKELSDSLGIPLVIGVLSDERTEGKVRMYERKFGKPSGAFFLYGAETGKFQNL